MKALILAAGTGNRMGSLTKDTPKAMIEVAGEVLIDRVIKFAIHPGVEEIGVVGGYCFDTLKHHLNDRDIRLFFNPDYRDGNIFTLRAAFDFLDDSFLMMNADHIYPVELMDHILEHAAGISAMCDFDRELSEDDMKVKLSDRKKLKQISKQLECYDGGYIGMTCCSKEMLDTYKKSVDDTINIYGKSSCVEFVLGHLAANNNDINICDTSGYRYLEIDTPDELKRAEQALMKG